MAGIWCLGQNYLLDGNEFETDILQKIQDFKVKIKISFLEEISKEINTAIQINNPIFLALDVFNVNINQTIKMIHKKVSMLKALYDH